MPRIRMAKMEITMLWDVSEDALAGEEADVGWEEMVLRDAGREGMASCSEYRQADGVRLQNTSEQSGLHSMSTSDSRPSR